MEERTSLDMYAKKSRNFNAQNLNTGVPKQNGTTKIIEMCTYEGKQQRFSELLWPFRPFSEIE